MAKEMAGFRKQQQRKDFVRHNEQIRIPRVLVIHDGKNLGEMSNRDALNMARSAGLDLVEVAPMARPPVCHITDYGKFMYDRQKKAKKPATSTSEKEVRFRYVISDHDLEIKANQVKHFLEKGFKVKCTVTFKERQKAHKELGFELLKRLIEMLKDTAVPEKPPAFEGANVSIRLELTKEAKKALGQA